MIFSFEITFKKENMVINYINAYGKPTSKISEWGVPDKVRNKFYEFINEEHSRVFMEFMPSGIMFKDFDIYKVG